MKILIVGDITARETTKPYYRNKDVDFLYGDTVKLFREADYRICNLECALTEADTGIDKIGPCLKSPKETAEVLRMLGVDLCAISNNHIFDFGRKGLLDTLEAIKENGMQYTGFGENYDDSRRDYVIEQNGEKIAVIAVCEHEYSYALDDRMGARPFDEFDTPLDVRAAKEKCDKVIVLYHGGKELCRYPSPRLRRACRALVKSGADVVLCQHSHCIGSYEKFEGAHILYGQGNFHFPMNPLFPPEAAPLWCSGLAATYDTESGEIAFTPILIEGEAIRIAPEDEAKAIMDAFDARTVELANGAWREGWHRFCEENKKNYTRVIRNAARDDIEEGTDNYFGHYLDCEAHTDVWRELYPTANLTNEKD